MGDEEGGDEIEKEAERERKRGTLGEVERKKRKEKRASKVLEQKSI